MKRTDATARPPRQAFAAAHPPWAQDTTMPLPRTGTPARHDAAGHCSIRAAALFAHRWTEGAVTAALTREGIQIHTFRGAAEWVAAVQTADFDVALIEDHGHQLATCLAMLRFRGTACVPIVAVGSGSAEQFSAALRLGVADYAIAGDAGQALVNRVLARVDVSRHSEQRELLHAGPCTLDAQARTLRFPGGELPLTWREFALAWVLFENAGQVVHLHTLSRQVWGTDVTVTKRTIEQHVFRLRQKLLQACTAEDTGLVLHAVTNVGYRLVVESRPPLVTGH